MTQDGTLHLAASVIMFIILGLLPPHPIPDLVIYLIFKLIHTPPSEELCNLSTISWVASSNEAKLAPNFSVRKDESPFSLMDTFKRRPNTLFISRLAHFSHLQKTVTGV